MTHPLGQFNKIVAVIRQTFVRDGQCKALESRNVLTATRNRSARHRT